MQKHITLAFLKPHCTPPPKKKKCEVSLRPGVMLIGHCFMSALDSPVEALWSSRRRARVSIENSKHTGRLPLVRCFLVIFLCFLCVFFVLFFFCPCFCCCFVLVVDVVPVAVLFLLFLLLLVVAVLCAWCWLLCWLL